MTRPRAPRARRLKALMVPVGAIALLGCMPAVSGAAQTQAPHQLLVAANAGHRADLALVADAKQLRRCVASHRSKPKSCQSTRKALQLAGSRLARAERRLSQIVHQTAALHAVGAISSSVRHNPRLAPTLRASHNRLTWSRVDRLASYIVVRKAPNQAPAYSVVHGTSLTPPALPGASVRYQVRTSVKWSAWSSAQSITYPLPSSKAAPGPDPRAAAPSITVSGTTLSWNAVQGVGTYVLRSSAPHRADEYSEVSGTSVTPPATPGTTVSYTLRTAVAGSAWASEVSIAYPAAAAPAPAPAPPSSSTPAHTTVGGPFEMGAVVGSNAMYELPWLKQLGAHTARIEESINSSVAEIEPVVHAYAAAGIRPLLVAGFNARIPSTAEAQNLASWAKAFGPGGTYWAGKGLPSGTEVSSIEFGNETNNPYQYLGTAPTNWQNEPAFLARAEEYARRLRDAQVAISESGANVGLLGIADEYSGFTTWVNAMFKAVPDLGQRVAGWTVHPYGPNWRTPIDTLIAATQAHGAPSTVPIYATEMGLSTDNGRCLSDNFGFNKCMTYEEAASTLATVIGEMRARYGSRLRSIYLFQARDQQPTGASTNREYYFGALQSNQAPKGAYTAEVQSLLAENP